MSGEGQKQRQQQLLRSAAQAQQVGSPYPPSMHGIPDEMLTAASPAGFNLLATTKVDRRQTTDAAASCRAYTGITGLRQLQADQASNSHGQPGCGWIYKPSAGFNPEINQGAFGSAKGPIADTLGSGSTWYWDLAKAEKDISTAICGSASSCDSLGSMGQYSNVCGYCPSSGSIIPIEMDAKGNAKARYPMSAMCEPGSIVTAGGACPSSSSSGGQGRSGAQVEGFAATLDDLANCKSPLSRDCVLLAARMAGCSDSGSLIAALGNAPKGKDYDSTLSSSAAYSTYQRYANPAITRAVMKDGSAPISTALNDFGTVLSNTQSPDTKLQLAARDLCLNANAFDAYDFCSEIVPATIINSNNITCVQQHWLQQGGTVKGRKYPTLAQWNGKSYQSYLTMATAAIAAMHAATTQGFRNRGVSDTKSREGFTASPSAILDVIGIDTSISTSSFPRSEANRGTEVVWIDTSAAAPTILRCSLNLASSLRSRVIPSIDSGQNYAAVYGIPDKNFTFIMASELRPDADTSLAFMINTHANFMLSMNQNPFEGTKYSSNDWGSWKFSASPGYQSSSYAIVGEQQLAQGQKIQQQNTLVFKFANTGGTPDFLFRAFTFRPDGGGSQVDTTQFMYLTQEAAAPWLQFEVCNRPSSAGVTRVGFNEVRFNGPANNKGMPTFDTTTSAVDVQTNDWYRSEVPMRKACISFPGPTSTWRTTANYAFGAFKTITLLARPTASLADGASCRLFSHLGQAEGGKPMGSALAISRSGSTYYITNGAVTAPIAMNTWNLIVIQYVHNTSGTGIVTHSFVHDTLGNLQTVTAQKKMLTSLAQIQTLTSSATAWPATMPGTLMLGAVDMASGQACVGDVAWIHGFRDYFTTTDTLQKEIKQTWITRWPRGADIPGQPEPAKLQEAVGADPLAACKIGASQGTFIRHPNGFIGWNPTGSMVINPVGSCAKGTCPGQPGSACRNFKQLTPDQFGKYTHCPNHFDCSMMAAPSSSSSTQPQGGCTSWTVLPGMDMGGVAGDIQCPPGSHGSWGPGRCNVPDLATAQAACSADPGCDGVSYHDKCISPPGYETRNKRAGPIMPHADATTWVCNRSGQNSASPAPAPPRRTTPPTFQDLYQLVQQLGGRTPTAQDFINAGLA